MTHQLGIRPPAEASEESDPDVVRCEREAEPCVM